MRLLTTSIATSALAALVLASPATSQDVPLPDLFSDTIDVRVVNVEVVVTDRDGNRVQGLQVGDFELLVDGEPVPIGYFTEIDDGTVRGATEQRIDEEAMPAVPSLEPDEPVRTNYLVFIDEYFAVRKQRDRVLKRLERDLAELGPHDQVALVAFDGRNVARLTDWTGARDELRDAFSEARKRKALGLMRRADIDPAAVAPDPPGAAASGPLAPDTVGGVESAPALNSVRRVATALNLSKRERAIQRSVLAATATVRSFADPPGRKAMLVLTDGWEVPGFTNPDPFGPPPPSIESIYGPARARREPTRIHPVSRRPCRSESPVRQQSLRDRRRVRRLQRRPRCEFRVRADLSLRGAARSEPGMVPGRRVRLSGPRDRRPADDQRLPRHRARGGRDRHAPLLLARLRAAPQPGR